VTKRGVGPKLLILSDPTDSRVLLSLAAEATAAEIAEKIGEGIAFRALSVDEVPRGAQVKLTVGPIVQPPQLIPHGYNERLRAHPATVEPQTYSHPSVSTPRAVDDSWASDYKTAHPGAYDVVTPPPAGAGPGGPVQTTWVRTSPTHGYNSPPGLV
jgi:hypothetical protein